jgi:hypothetical protein
LVIPVPWMDATKNAPKHSHRIYCHSGAHTNRGGVGESEVWLPGTADLIIIPCFFQEEVVIFENKMLLKNFKKKQFAGNRTDKQLSAKVSRCFRLLRIHVIIRKLPMQHRCQSTLKDLKLNNILNTFLAVSKVEKLMKKTV